MDSVCSVNISKHYGIDMRKKIEYYKREYWQFGINIATPYERERWEKPYNTLNIDLFNHAWWFKIPEFIKPKEKWVDTTNMSWNKDKEGPHGFTEEIRKEYGVTFCKEAVHIHYGIQPGSWTNGDPANSDHTKLFWYPWNLEIVRHDLLYPNGEVYYRNVYNGKRRKTYSWYEILNEMDCPYPSYPNKDKVTKTVTLKHYNKTDGSLQRAEIQLCGEEREWRPRCTRWLPIFKHIRRVVDCTSDIELGTRAGSWKGGMMGWSCDWRDGESMYESFWRWYKTWDGN